MDLGNFKLKVELCELENVAWYITFQDFILTPQKNLAMIFVMTRRSWSLPSEVRNYFNQRKTFFTIYSCPTRIFAKKNYNNNYQPVQYFFFEKIPTWVVEENRSVFALKPTPPPSPFAVFLAGNQFAGKTGNSVKINFDCLWKNLRRKNYESNNLSLGERISS